MDTNRLIEKKCCSFNGKKMQLPNEVYLNKASLSDCEIFIERNVSIKDLSDDDDVVVICNKDDLDDFYASLEIDIPIESLRIGIR